MTFVCILAFLCSVSFISSACSKLRCTDCDFSIARFDNMKWHDSTDYLFLRNNMPDFHRLRSKLVTKKGRFCCNFLQRKYDWFEVIVLLFLGFRAYACQCKWISVKDVVDLRSQPELKWVCGRH